VAGATRSGYRLADPGYPAPNVIGGSQAAPGSNVVLSPGLYAADPNFNNGLCYFLSTGVYEWQAGYTNAGALVSNELRPPDEPDNDNDEPASQQLWDTGKADCAGSFQVSAVGGSALQTGTWAVEVTSTRTDVYGGTSYSRESAPSYCRTVTIGASQAIKVQISNVPGATGYNVYFDPPPTSGCRGQFGFGGSIAVTGPVTNTSTSSCPSFSGSCSLGNESAVFDASVLGALFVPNNAPPGVLGAYPPDPELQPQGSNMVDQSPPRATPPAGDRADENQCDTVGGVQVGCPAAITPGAVEFYIPSGGCLNATNKGDNYLFGGYQFDWVLIDEPLANTCSNSLGASSDSAYIGLIYLPGAAVTVNKAATFRTDVTGGIMADTVTFTGHLPSIEFDPDYAPAPPASRIAG